MSQTMISVRVRLLPQVDAQPIVRAVVGCRGKLRPHKDMTGFWAVTAMTLKQIEAIEGVKDCTLCPTSW